MIRHLNTSDFKEMPWANGKGTTVEMLRIERDGQVMLRLSRAMVVENGAFSLFPGIERNLTVLSGPGFDLVGAGVHLHALPLVPVAFAGDVKIRAEKVTERSEDFNVMTARDLPLPQVSVAPTGLLLPLGAILALEPGVVADKAVARYDLVLTDQEVHSDVPLIHVHLPGWNWAFLA